MRPLFVVALVSLACACSSEGRGDGKKGTFAGNGGGPSAFDDGASGPSFGENAGSGPSFGENAGSAPAFGENASSGGEAGDPTAACSKTARCAAPAECTNASGGFCIVRCTLTSGADIEAVGCPAGLFCLRSSAKSTTGVCLRACAAAADCPVLSGLRASCESVLTGRFCVWSSGITDSTPTPAGG